MLRIDGYKWKDDQVILSSLTRACKMKNDQNTCKIPIQRYLLEMLLFEICRLFDDQRYLMRLYQAIFVLGYYGLMRVGELTKEDHPIKACNVHIGQNKDKILLVLYSSKTHSRANPLQRIKISASDEQESTKKMWEIKGKLVRFFCPFNIVRTYISAQGDYINENENFFVFSDKTAVKPKHPNKVLKTCLQRINIDDSLYLVHSLRAGTACDMLKQGHTIDHIKYVGRWKSNAVYKYLKL